MSTILSLFTFLFGLALCVFPIVCDWKLFEKAGEAGWACLIPFYNTYVEFRIAKKRKLFFLYVICAILSFASLYICIMATISAYAHASGPSLFSELGFSQIQTTASIIIGFISNIIMAILNIVRSVGFAKSFGQSLWFAVGLIFLPIIFRAIIAFSDNIHYNYETDIYST